MISGHAWPPPTDRVQLCCSPPSAGQTALAPQSSPAFNELAHATPGERMIVPLVPAPSRGKAAGALGETDGLASSAVVGRARR